MAPKELDRKAILWATCYENMSGDQRGKVFRAYSYDDKRLKYVLKEPRHLDDIIIKKLIDWEE